VIKNSSIENLKGGKVTALKYNPWTRYTDLVNMIDKDRLMSTIELFGSMSDTPGNGVTRLAYSPLYIKAKNVLADLMVDSGLEVTVSPIGNTFGRLAPDHCQNPSVLAGSHIDSVVHGGQFDGVVGIACALEVLCVLQQIRNHLIYPIEIVDFAMEESSRFGAPYGFGSYIMAGGDVDRKTLLLQDSERLTLADAIQGVKELSYHHGHIDDDHITCLEKAISYVERSRRPSREIKAYVELHVEQGQELEEYSVPIGVVTRAAAPTRLLIELIGQQNHSGTTPMHKRKNALCAAAEVVLAVDEFCQQAAENETVGAITKLIVEPNVVNVIPGRTLLTLDLRGTNQESKQQVVQSLRFEIDRICSKRGIHTDIQVLVDEKPIIFSEAIGNAIETSCLTLNIPSRRMPSRAGHDACHVANFVKEVGMIFVPSKDGISHSPLEWTNPEDIYRGAQVLLLTLLQLAIE
jgi:hydantoinase/carbamoylase family amidase